MANDIPWTRIKALSFDIYGTLVDYNKGILEAVRATSIDQYLPENDAKILEDLHNQFWRLEQEEPSLRKSDLNEKALKQYASDLGLEQRFKLSKEDIDRAAKEFQGGRMGTHPPFPDTIAALTRLSKHYKLIALSNVDHSSLNELLSDQFGGSPFDKEYIAEDIGSYKPHHNNFSYLLNHLKQDFDIEQSDLCHVAQSLPVDHTATKPMGIRSVWIDRYDILGSSGRTAEDMQAEYGYKLRVRTLEEIADIVDQAFGDS